MVTSLETLIAVSASGPELFTSVREPGLRAEFQEYVARCRAYLHALKTAYANRDATELRRIGGQYRGFAEESKQWMAKLEALSAKLRSDSPSRQPSLAEVQGPNFERKMNSLTFDQRVHVWAEQFELPELLIRQTVSPGDSLAEGNRKLTLLFLLRQKN